MWLCLSPASRGEQATARYEADCRANPGSQARCTVGEKVNRGDPHVCPFRLFPLKGHPPEGRGSVEPSKVGVPEQRGDPELLAVDVGPDQLEPVRRNHLRAGGRRCEAAAATDIRSTAGRTAAVAGGVTPKAGRRQVTGCERTSTP